MRLSHVAWNVAGLSFPLVVAALTVPQLLENIGEERFGLLALAWGLIGYAGALDLGIGRALTQMVSKLIGAQTLSPVPDVLFTASRMTLITGTVGGVAIVGIVCIGGSTWLSVQSTSQMELQYSMLLLATALPVQAISATYRGLNEAFMNFRGINLIRASLGVMTFGGPYCMSFFDTRLPFLIVTLVVSRLMALLAFRYLASLTIKGIGIQKTGEKSVYVQSTARSLLSFGGWVTVSSVASPLMNQLDRFMIAFTLSAGAVAVYVIPYEIVVQSLILVGAVSSVMFPTLSKMIHEQNQHGAAFFNTWLWRVAGVMLIVCLLMAWLLPVVLRIWLGNNLNPTSIVVGQILCAGVFFNAIGAMFFSLLHARGQADITAKLHMIELPLYVVALVYLLTMFGLVGAAYAWAGRMAFDALVLARISKSRHSHIE